MVFRSAGVSGYVGKTNVYRSRRRNKRKARFSKKIMRVVDKDQSLKSSSCFLTPYKVSLAQGGSEGLQKWQTVCVKNSGADVAACQSNINTETGQAQTSITRYNLNSYVMQCAMKNQAQTNAIVEIYEMVPRVATSNPTLFESFATNITTAQSGVDQSILWGWTPFQSSPLCEMWKILNKKRYLLAPGAADIFEIRESKKMSIDTTKYYGIAGAAPIGTQMVPRYSKVWVACVRGEPINDSVNKANVSTSLFAVDFVVREDYQYDYNYADTYPRTTRTNSLAAIANNQEAVLIDTGAIIAPPVIG